MSEQKSEQPGTKPLPRTAEGNLINIFPANGKKYYILADGDAFPIGRWMLWGKFTQQYLSGQDFQTMYNQLDTTERLLDGYTRGKTTFSDIVLHVRAGKEALKSLSAVRFDTGLYLATLFIVGEGENINEWTQAQADEKISDWQAEGYGATDFFDLSARMVIAYLAALKKLAEAMMGIEEDQPTTPDSLAPTASQTTDLSGMTNT